MRARIQGPASDWFGGGLKRHREVVWRNWNEAIRFNVWRRASRWPLTDSVNERMRAGLKIF